MDEKSHEEKALSKESGKERGASGDNERVQKDVKSAIKEWEKDKVVALSLFLSLFLPSNADYHVSDKEDGFREYLAKETRDVCVNSTG